MNRQTRNTHSVNLRSAWEELARVRAAIDDYFASCTEELRHAATMAALELAENVLKHGADSGLGQITMAEVNGDVIIATHNRVDSLQKAQAVRQRITCIAERGARELYIERMLEILRQREARDSGLGLLRVAYEGAFRLSCEVMGDDRVHIEARRRAERALSS